MIYRCGYYINRCYIKAMRKFQMYSNLFYLIGDVMDVLEYINEAWEYNKDNCRYYCNGKPVAGVKIEEVAKVTGKTPLKVFKAMSMFCLLGFIEKVMVESSMDGTKTVLYIMNDLTSKKLFNIDNKAGKLKKAGITVEAIDYFSVLDSFDIDEADRVFCMNREAINLVKAENFDEEEAEYETDPAFKEFYVRYFNEKDMLR